MVIEQSLEESDLEDRWEDANNLQRDIAGGYFRCNMEESVLLDPELSKLSENTDALITVVMAKGVAGPMMSTK
jgi:hypothetical protein